MCTCAGVLLDVVTHEKWISDALIDCRRVVEAVPWALRVSVASSPDIA